MERVLLFWDRFADQALTASICKEDFGLIPVPRRQ